jgi:hypothetical protein
MMNICFRTLNSDDNSNFQPIIHVGFDRQVIIVERHVSEAVNALKFG